MSMPNTWPYNKDRGCPAGYAEHTPRNALGRRRAKMCVKKTKKAPLNRAAAPATRRGSRRSSRSRPKSRFHIPSMRSLARMACPEGMIQKKGFKRKYSSAVREGGYTVRRSSGKVYKIFPEEKNIYVPPSCVKNTGKPQKGVPSRIGPLKKGELSQFGYSYRRDTNTRRKSLRRAVEKYGALGVYRKLDAIAKLSVSKVPEAAKIFAENRDWVRESFKHP